MRRMLPLHWPALVLGALLGLVLLLAGPAARADTAVQQYTSFSGQVNFTGTVETMRTAGNNSYNNSACSITGSISAKLSGVPTGATILSAQLYWAGSGNTVDNYVTFDGVGVYAGRQYTSRTVGNGMNYFSGAADVTARVRNKLNPNTTYTFSGLSINNGSPWCASQAVVGGFALLVVYSHPDEPFRLLNLYEGFQYFQNNGFTINLGNFNVPRPLPSNVTGRIGHITWEGDATLSQGGENLLFNGKELTDSMNPAGNQFNSASNINGDYYTYGIDFDAYTLDANFITPGQSTGTTTYRSGQDLVLLSAEIVAMPFVGNADLALAMTRTGDLRIGSTAYYTLTVSNNGTDVETGPITITDTLPSGLKLVSTSGSGWSCSSTAGNGGTTLVTCTRTGQLAAGARANALTITVTPNTTGTYTNTATVAGRTGDGNTANNTATNTSSAIDTGSAAVVFTTEPCTSGDLLVTAPTDAGCHRFIGPVTAAATDTKIYVTAIAGGRASAISGSDYTLTIGLAATCLPYSNVALTYAQAGLGLDCKGSWKYLSVTVPGGKASATLPNGSSFFYADVGRISLSLSYQGTVMGTVNFISRPSDIRFQTVFRNADGVADLLGTGADNWKKPSPTAFARSGESFTMRLGALMADNNYAPSFGKEPTALKGVMESNLIDLDFQLDLFAADPLASPVLPVADKEDAIDKVVKDAFALDQNFTLNASIAGALDAKARWFEAGYLAITPYLSDYLGTGVVGGPGKAVRAEPARIVSGTRVVGHFYPDHFQSQIVAPFGCTAEMACPTDFPVAGAIYSNQPFTFTVIPFALPRDGVEQPLSLYRNLAGLAGNANANVVNGVVYRNVGLSAVVKPNDTTSSPLTGFAVDPANPLQTSGGPYDFPDMKTTGTYALGNPFVAGSSPAATGGRVAPTLFYVRASMRERLSTGPTTTKDIFISSATLDTTRAVQYEDGLMAVSGRLFVPNVFGSELLSQPINLAAQYWNGKAWVTMTSDSITTVGDKLVPVANSCTRVFAASKSAAPSACDAGAVSALGDAAIPLSGGLGLLNLKSPGRGNVGSFDLTVAGGNAGIWLPSTRGRVTFGVYRSPLIYLREIYR